MKPGFGRQLGWIAWLLGGMGGKLDVDTHAIII